ncbi:MAG: hypothetical protein KGD63_02755 [Candidatus Lokiarchaeota archaeon]|nr:hypothetical protein [Candidatus Lokiarchaeota archaeon]
MNGYTLVQVKENLKQKISSILDRNDNVSIKKIINELHSEHKNLDKIQIENSIKSMVKNGLILVGSELTQEKVMDFIDRKRIFKLLCENPGKNMKDISINLNISLVKTIWHLTLLQKFYFIKTKKEKKEEKYYSLKKMEEFI